MPTSSTHNAPKKCKVCRKDFTNTWLPNNACCRLESLALGDEFFRQYALQDPKLKGVRSLDSFVTQNTSSPFHTLQKPTCGSNFSFNTVNKKMKHGVLPADHSKYQNTTYTVSQTKKL